MFKTLVSLCTATLLLASLTSPAQVDTTYVYKTGMPYGTLDIRLAKSSTRYYYLQEGKTFSFRERARSKNKLLPRHDHLGLIAVYAGKPS